MIENTITLIACCIHNSKSKPWYQHISTVHQPAPPPNHTSQPPSGHLNRLMLVRSDQSLSTKSAQQMENTSKRHEKTAKGNTIESDLSFIFIGFLTFGISPTKRSKAQRGESTCHLLNGPSNVFDACESTCSFRTRIKDIGRSSEQMTCA